MRKTFDFFKPATAQEALRLFNRYKGAASFLAGGTDLVAKMRSGTARPKALIDIKAIGQLSGVRKTRTRVTIGPLTTITDISQSKILKTLLPVLPKTALLMASPQVRNRGTVGGNLCNAAPSADMAPPLIVLGAKARFLTRQGTRTVRLEDFFTGPGQTLVTGKGLLSAIVVPVPGPRVKAAYQVLTLREAMDLSVVSAAAMVRKERGIIREARIALGAVAPVPMRAPEAEAALVGTRGKDEDIEKAALCASAECVPITDVRGSREYRREMVSVVVRRVLEEVRN